MKIYEIGDLRPDNWEVVSVKLEATYILKKRIRINGNCDQTEIVGEEGWCISFSDNRCMQIKLDKDEINPTISKVYFLKENEYDYIDHIISRRLLLEKIKCKQKS